MSDYDWAGRFAELYEKAVALYGGDRRGARTFFSASEQKFIHSIGCSEQELYDFAEDWCAGKSPDFGTALLITAVRRDYYLSVQGGARVGRVEPSDTLPARDATLGGIEWLPRLIEKAKRKLQGAMSDDVMYCCGGDRHFFKKHRVHPADFLRSVWSEWDNDTAILDYVRRRTSG